MVTPHLSVPRILPNGGTVVVLGSGPSLARADVEFCRGRADALIAVNDSYLFAPWATALWAADARWWKWHQGARDTHTLGRVTYPAFTGRFKFSLSVTQWTDVQVIGKGPERGLSMKTDRVALGRNGVYQATNLAVHFGATRIIYLGVDMSNGARADGKGVSDHFFGHHPDRSAAPFSICHERFASLVKPLADIGVEVLNCSRRTALKVFPCVPLEDALATAPLRVAV